MFFEGLLTGLSIVIMIIFSVLWLPLWMKKILFWFPPLFDFLSVTFVFFISYATRSATLTIASVFAGIGISLIARLGHNLIYKNKFKL